MPGSIRHPSSNAHRIAGLCSLGLLMTLACCIVFGCAKNPPAPPKRTAATPDPVTPLEVNWPPDDRRNDRYVGSERCRDCHADLFARYQSHPMAHATTVVGDRNELPFPIDKTVQHPPREYSVTWEDSSRQLLQTDRFLDSEGEPIYEQSVQADLIVGSGERGHTLIANNEGVLHQLPLTYYSEQETWDLSPGYSPQSHSGFERRIGSGCIACHVGHSKPAEGYHRFDSNRVVLEGGISCERCHGPGEEHADYHEGMLDLPGDPLVDLSGLDVAERESVCFQCHLHGIERILQPSRNEFDFRPGDSLSEIWVVFSRGTRVGEDQRTTAVSQVEQMVSSRCFQQSDGMMGCTSCHDPHGKPASERSVEFYRGRCLKCHTAPQQGCSLPRETRLERNGEDSCIACHMPQLSASDVPHTSQTDHRILRRPSRFRVVNDTDSQPEPFAPDLFPISKGEKRRAYGLLQSKRAANMSSAQVAGEAAAKLEPLIGPKTNDVAMLDAQSLNLAFMGEYDAATGLAHRGLQVEPANESLLETLVGIAELTRQYDEGLRYADRYLKANPWSSAMLLRKAMLHARLRQFAKARTAALAALQRNPLLHSAREIVVATSRQLDDSAMADKHQSILDRIRRAQRSHRSSPGNSRE